METLCLGCMRMKQNAPVCEHCGFDERKENQPHQLPMGTLLQNQYLIGRVLGQGGFGITYIGWDQHLSIPVAIKEYFPSSVVQRHSQLGTKIWLANGEDSQLFQKHSSRFLKEARVLAQLSEISEIVHIQNYFSQNDTAYIVMEYVQGTTLKEHLKKLGHPMTEEEALSAMEPVLKALQKVHDHGLIHRDISPDNIMLPAGGGIKLIDFGTVRYVDDSGKSKSTETVLKPGFAPMEQYNSRGNLGTWTDVYAICATFCYLLTGKVPVDVHTRLEEGEALLALREKSGISEQLIQVLENGMKIRSAERIQTVAELYDLLYSKQQEPVSFSAAAPVLSPKKKKFPQIAALALIVAVAAVFMLLSTPRKDIAPAAPAETTEALSALQTETEAETEAETEVATEAEVVDLTIIWNGVSFRPEQAFGSIGSTGEQILKVFVDDKRISDFTVRTDNPEYIKVSRTRDGLIRLLPVKSFEKTAMGFTVTYKGNDYTFYCRDSSFTEQIYYPRNYYERHYTDEELQAMVDADLSFDDACEKLSTIGDAVQYLTLRGFRNESLSFGMDNLTIFELNCGDGVTCASLFNALLQGDYEEQGYAYIFYGMHDQVISYFVINGVYYFCDFVRPFLERKEAPLYHVTANPGTLYHAVISHEPYASNNPDSNLYLLGLFTVRTDRIPTTPLTRPRNLPGQNLCQIPFTPAEEETIQIIYAREGYTFEF